MKAIDAAEHLIGARTLSVAHLFSGSLCMCRLPLNQEQIAARLMELLWAEADYRLRTWQLDDPTHDFLQQCARVWLLERTVKCRWKVARQIARRLLDEEKKKP